MHVKDFTNKCNRSLHSEYNTMKTNAAVEIHLLQCFIHAKNTSFLNDFNVPSGMGNLTTLTEWIKLCNLALYVIE